MTESKPLVHFYDLSGSKPWSPATWRTRFVLNYKGIPYTTTYLSYPAIKPKFNELFPKIDTKSQTATVPMIQILGENPTALHDSHPITRLLNERFPESAGYKNVTGLDQIEEYDKRRTDLAWAIVRWILFDVYSNTLDPSDGSKEFFRETREKDFGMKLEDVLIKTTGGEEPAMENIRKAWKPLQERMQREDGLGEPSYHDFVDAGFMKWIEAASSEKYEKTLGLYGDNTFTKLMKKVERYS